MEWCCWRQNTDECHKLQAASAKLLLCDCVVAKNSSGRAAVQEKGNNQMNKHTQRERGVVMQGGRH